MVSKSKVLHRPERTEMEKSRKNRKKITKEIVPVAACYEKAKLFVKDLETETETEIIGGMRLCPKALCKRNKRLKSKLKS